MMLGEGERILLGIYFLHFQQALFEFLIIFLEMSSRKIKRKALRANRYQEDLGSNPTSPDMIMGETGIFTSDKVIDENDPRYRSQALLNLIHYAGVMELFKQSIRKFKGTNCILTYHPSYDFSEKWEETSKTKFERNQNVYLSANGIFFIIAMLVMIQKIPMIWFLSVHRIFGFSSQSIWLLVGLVFAGIDLTLKMHLVYSQVVKNASSEEMSQNQFKLSIFSCFIGDLVTLLVYILAFNVLQHNDFGFEMILDFVVVFIQSMRFLEIYNTLSIMLISLKYKNYVNLFSFLSKLLIVLHVSALIVYSVTLLHEENNWLRNIGKSQADPYTKYIYSLYFTGTTMFTVGYGDIIPKNQLQMMVILLIQLLGIIVMGYIISEIGHTLTVMRLAQDDFEQDIQNADTICNNYQLSLDLRHKVRNYIVNNRLASEELNVKEEHNFLMKLNEELRSEVNHVNHLNIIKTSLFFICNWSKKMQTDVSRKLQKYFFSPNERIVKLNKLYIITNGKIDVYTERKAGNKIYCRKRLKTIEREPKKQVFSNVYGCTSLFTGKPGHLSAVSKDFAVCYALDYNDIFDTLNDDEKDFQYYHETKCRLEQETFPQKYEVPTLINNRQHFCPTKYIVLRKYQKNLQSAQERKESLRTQRKAKRVFLDKEENHVNPPSESDNDNSDGEDIDNDETDHFKIPPNLNLPGLLSPQKESRKSSQHHACISFRSCKRRFFSRLDEERAKEKEMNELIESNVVATSLFQVGRQYSRYFKQGNCGRVLSKYGRNTIQNFKEINSKNIRMDWIDLLIFAQKLHKGNTTQF